MTTTDSGPRPLPIIHINAFPGTGKTAIANELVTHFQTDSVKIVQNQFLYTVVPGVVVPHDTWGYQQTRYHWRCSDFDNLIDDPGTHTSAYIFTDFEASDALGSAMSEEYALCAQARGCDYIPINLIRDRGPNQNARLHEIEGYDHALTLNINNLPIQEVVTKIFQYLIAVSPALRSAQR